MEYANWFVVVMGVGIVFFGLIVLILAVTIMGKLMGQRGGSGRASGLSASGAGASGKGAGAEGKAQLGELCTDPEIVSAIAAAIADDMGTDVGALRIHSIRKVL